MQRSEEGIIKKYSVFFFDKIVYVTILVGCGFLLPARGSFQRQCKKCLSIFLQAYFAVTL